MRRWAGRDCRNTRIGEYEKQNKQVMRGGTRTWFVHYQVLLSSRVGEDGKAIEGVDVRV